MLGEKGTLSIVQGQLLKSATSYGKISLTSVFGVSSNIESIEGSKF